MLSGRLASVPAHTCGKANRPLHNAVWGLLSRLSHSDQVLLHAIVLFSVLELLGTGNQNMLNEVGEALYTIIVLCSTVVAILAACGLFDLYKEALHGFWPKDR